MTNIKELLQEAGRTPALRKLNQEELIAWLAASLRDRGGRETQGTITAWQDATFPKAKGVLATYALRMFEEAVELCVAAGWTYEDLYGEVDDLSLKDRSQLWEQAKPELDKVPAECADVLIVLYGVAKCAGVDLHAEVDRKMEVNRKRKWAMRDDGHADHVKEPA